MDNLMENIQKVMSDPESMKQINELAQMLGLSGENTPPPPPKPEPEFDFKKLFSSPEPQKNKEDNVDFTKLLQLSKIFEKASKPDKNTQLILALKPHLKEETQHKADSLIKIFKLRAVYPLLKESGIIGGDLSGIL
ncbi:MAG: hypothetical protein IJX42_05535 [Oscillospiraceae bacterium]|nr:hypothetical protein [Oscillospiraceae bacterium]